MANINAGNLKFAPAANANGAGYASFTFQVQDNGGTANGGVDLDASANTLTIDVTGVNDAPTGTDGSVITAEDSVYVFSTVDFGFGDTADTPANALSAVRISTLPNAGNLTLSGVAVAAGQTVTALDIAAGELQFAAAANANGASYASFTFQVQDNGGTVNGGVNLDQTANTLLIDVTPVNDAPAIANNALAVLKGSSVILSTSQLSGLDIDNAGGSLVFSASAVSHGTFQYVANPGVSIASFTQAQLGAGQVVFVHDGGSSAPSYSISVSDGMLTDGPHSASITFTEPAADPVVSQPLPTPPTPAPTPNPVPATPAPTPSAPEQTSSSDSASAPGAAISGQAVLPPEERHAIEAAVNTMELAQAATRGAGGRSALDMVALRAAYNPPPIINPEDFTLVVRGSDSQYTDFGPATHPNWTAQITLADDDRSELHRSELNVVMDSAQMGGIALTVGAVWWASRVTGVIGSLLASLPAWRHIDPLPVMGRDEEERPVDWQSGKDTQANADEVGIAMMLEGPSRRFLFTD